MIYDSQSLKSIYNSYSNINQKISLEVKKNNLIKIKRGLYTNNLAKDRLLIANICCDPSYLSFEYALSFYGLIPEHVSVFTSACYGKKDNNTYILKDATFEYRRIPNNVFSFGIVFYKNEDKRNFKFASKEKALCDTLYSKYPVRSVKDLKIMLFEDLRIDEEEFMKLDFNFIRQIAPLYHSNTLLTLSKYIGGFKNDNGY